MDKEPNNRMEIGPQYAKDNPFARRMRFHQSWYRAEVLKAPYGTGPKPSNTTEYGNMLRLEDGERGCNFLTAHIFEVAKRRLGMKKGAIDRFRLLCNMLSSQPMCFNLFGPLVDDLELATQLAQAILPGEIQRVTKVQLEFAPEPARQFLNDQTAFDAFISFKDADNQAGFIGVETKLVEAFSGKMYRSERYNFWTEHPKSPWLAERRLHLQRVEVNQLWRDHLLAAAMQLAPGARYGWGRFLLVYHPLDVECVRALELYMTTLKPEDRSFMAVPLDMVVEKWRQAVRTAAEKQWLNNFSLRYLDLQASESEFGIRRES
jgi:hypothetical protein